MSSALVIANPTASQFTGGLHRSAMRALARRHDAQAAWPTSPDESRAMAAEAASAGADIVVAMGGDGVVHHVAQGLIGTPTILGIVPVGTTNVLARILGAPSNPKRAVRVLSRGFDVARVPTLRVRGRSYQTAFERSALFSLGVGPDAAVVEVAEREPHRKRSFGSVHYLRSALTTIRTDLRKRPPTVHIEAGDRSADGIGLLTQFHDVYTYFGRTPLSFGLANPMSLLVVEQLRLRRSAGIIGRAARGGSLDEVDGLQVWDAVTEFTVEAEHPVEVQADGELLAAVTSLEAVHSPDSLTVAVSPH